jgi:hypothetical protein
VLSLDCGTKETFSRIKRSDAFDVVVENLRKYHDAGANIHLKYIIISENSEHDDDLRGFIRLAGEIGAKSIRISCDTNLNHAVIPPAIIDFAVRLGKSAVEKGFETLILPHFGDENMKLITESVFRPENN